HRHLSTSRGQKRSLQPSPGAALLAPAEPLLRSTSDWAFLRGVCGGQAPGARLAEARYRKCEVARTERGHASPWSNLSDGQIGIACSVTGRGKYRNTGKFRMPTDKDVKLL